MIKKIIIISLCLLTSISICYMNANYVNTKQIITKQEIINSDKLNINNDILIAYFSDLHYGKYIDSNHLDSVVKKINDYKPDIIIFGGDLIDEEIDITDEDRQHLIESLCKLDSKYGIFAVYGEEDDDLGASFEETKQIYNQTKIRILDNDYVSIQIEDTFINIAGINSIYYSSDNINELFSSINTNYYTYVISHYPDTFNDVLQYDFDYMIAGHSHGGEVYLPIISLFNRKEGCKSYYRKTHIKNNRILDISSGVGRSGVNARLNADAQINLYRLSPKQIETTIDENKDAQ